MFRPPLRALLRLLSLASSPQPAQMPTPIITPYTPGSPPPHPFPYSTQDLTPLDTNPDTSFYNVPRFVAHIDDNAIALLRQYYASVLPTKGRILDFCSSWVSHYPEELGEKVKSGELEVLGLGMNSQELRANPLFGGHPERWAVLDLNDPNAQLTLPGTNSGDREGAGEGRLLDASTCAVSIDYITRPVAVLSAIRSLTRINGTVHLAVSDRCFPMKVVGRWLRVGERERLQMVGDYLWWGGWREVEIVGLCDGVGGDDPLWVVRGRNLGEGEGDGKGKGAGGGGEDGNI
jgi:hypothetical protein